MLFITKIYTNCYVYFPTSVGDLKPKNIRFIYFIFVVIIEKRRDNLVSSLFELGQQQNSKQRILVFSHWLVQWKKH